MSRLRRVMLFIPVGILRKIDKFAGVNGYCGIMDL